MLSVVLLGSITVVVIFTTASGVHHRVQSIAPTATATSDLLESQSCSWPNSSTFFFQDGKYYIQNTSPKSIALALCQDHRFANVRLSVNASEVAPADDRSDYYGVVLRAAEDQSQYYVFEISPYDGGQYYISRYGGSGKWDVVDIGQAPSVKKPGQDNTITVEALGTTFTFFVNGQQVGKPFSDRSTSAFSFGEIGLVVEDTNEEVAFSNLQIKAIKSP